VPQKKTKEVKKLKNGPITRRGKKSGGPETGRKESDDVGLLKGFLARDNLRGSNRESDVRMGKEL